MHGSNRLCLRCAESRRQAGLPLIPAHRTFSYAPAANLPAHPMSR